MIGLAEYMQARRKAHTHVELCLMLGCSMLALRRFERRYSLRWLPVPRSPLWSRLLRALRMKVRGEGMSRVGGSKVVDPEIRDSVFRRFFTRAN